ncbi:prolipoprotein diacylglyceryl transferase [Geomonas propionica]|uniref:Uncharacterized protein n=1 Tax=Geomonas propionica TaxID=2798582 RepID=A0ABS0YQ15_9BACT|nr:hypothetical protein [Geomonas propionica]MBJ6799862.1 hypothetical protein [Geomonas propionica]
MYRSLFVLLPLLAAVMTGPAFAEESGEKQAEVPLWRQTTKGTASSPDAKPEAVKPELKPEAAQEASQEVKQEGAQEPKPEAQPEAAPDAAPEAKPDAAPEAKPDAAPETKPDAAPEAKPDAAPEAKPDAAPETKHDAAPGTKQEAKQEGGQQAQPTQEAGKAVGKEIDFGTQEQYRSCMYSEDHIKDLRKMLEEHIAQNNEAMMEIKKQAAALLEMQRKVVLSDDAQVEEFNRRTQEHNLVVKAANEASDKLKRELESFNDKSIEHNQNCASLIVKMSDRDAVIKERTPAVSQ